MTAADLLQGKLYAALHCIYLENGDDVILSLGAYRLHPGPFTLLDRTGVFVRGHNAQGCAEDWPVRQPAWTDAQFVELEHEAAFVRLSWILSHLIMQDGQFHEAVKLVLRASETMGRVALIIREAALGLLAEVPEMPVKQQKDKPQAPLAMEEARIRFSCTEEMSPTAPLLPHQFVTYMRTKAAAPKSEERKAFEAEVLEVFSFGVCPATRIWDLKNELSLSFTCKRMFYDEMAHEERAASGSVELRRIVADLVDGRTEDAARASLVAACALDELARRLRAACAGVEGV